MSDHSNLLAQLASMRERTISFQHALYEQYPPHGEIDHQIQIVLSAFSSIESELQGVPDPQQASVFTDAQILEIATAVSQKLGKAAILLGDPGSMPISKVMPGKPS